MGVWVSFMRATLHIFKLACVASPENTDNLKYGYRPRLGLWKSSALPAAERLRLLKRKARSASHIPHSLTNILVNLPPQFPALGAHILRNSLEPSPLSEHVHRHRRYAFYSNGLAAGNLELRPR